MNNANKAIVVNKIKALKARLFMAENAFHKEEMFDGPDVKVYASIVSNLEQQIENLEDKLS